MSLSSVSWKSIYFSWSSHSEARTLLSTYVCSYHWRVLYHLSSNSTRFLKETLHLQTSLCCFGFKDTACPRVVAALLHDPSSCPEVRLDCALAFCILHHIPWGGTVWSAGHWHEPLLQYFFYQRTKSKLHNLPALPGWPHLLSAA